MPSVSASTETEASIVTDVHREGQGNMSPLENMENHVKLYHFYGNFRAVQK